MSNEETVFTQRSNARIPAGMVLNNTFQVDTWISSGGMGEIYKGHSVQTGDLVAIKLIRPEMAQIDTVLALFRKEASVLHNLLHEAIVRYYVFSEDPTLRRPYLVMEFVDGPSLADVIRAGPLPYESVRELQRRLATALQSAHDLGIVHRDISPDNVILPASDVKRAKIIDFGIAKAANIGDTIIGGGFAGKHKYVSPEQLGLFGGEITPKSDTYSLGLVLAEALTGRAADMGNTQVEMVERRRELPDLSRVDPRVRPLIERMVQPRPADRPTMAEVAAWEGDTGAATLVTRSPTKLERRRRSFAGRLSLVVALAGLAVVAVLVLNNGLDRFSLGQPPPSPPASTTSAPSSSQTLPTLPAPAPAEQGTSSSGPPPATPAAPTEAAASPPSPAPKPPQSTSPATVAETSAPVPPETPQTPTNLQAGEATPSDSAPPAKPPSSETAVANVEPTAPALPQTPEEKIADFVTRYDGGRCFFATPTAITATSVKIEGFGTSADPFETFLNAFKRTFQLDPDIVLRPVDEAQCPAVDFLAATRTGAMRAGAVALDSDRLGAGDRLSGTVDVEGGSNVSLLLVSATGLVSRLADLENDGTGIRRFSYDIGDAPGKFLLIAVASSQPLEVLRESGVSAEAFFALALQQARKANDKLAAAAKYFERRG